MYPLKILPLFSIIISKRLEFDVMNDQAVTNALYITPKISGALSIVGSLLIVAHVTRSRRNKYGRDQRSATHARLLLGLSMCDLCSSTAFFVWSWAVPPNTGYGKWQYGTRGTCQAQGFFLQICKSTRHSTIHVGVDAKRAKRLLTTLLSLGFC